MAKSKPHTDSLVWMSGGYKAKDILLKRAIVREGLSKLTETTIEFQSKNKAVKLEDIVGRTMTVHLKTMDKKERIFTGTCISVENQGFFDGYGQYVAEVRPWFWLLTRAQNCRIFQEMTVIDIVEAVFSDHGFSDVKKRQNGSYQTRNYCVQYRETDYDFICRLLEEEGLYFYFDNKMDANKIEELVIADGVGGHSPLPINGTIDFIARDDSGKIREDHIAEWAKEEVLTRGLVTLEDYDFEAPSSEIKVSNKIEKGSHSHKKFEIYDYPGHYRDTGLGDDRARVRMEAEAIKHKRWRGASSVRTLGTGYTFKLKDHPEKAANAEYLVTDATHYLQVNTDYKDQELRHDLKPLRADFPEEMKGDAYACTFGAIPKADQYRAPLVTEWPTISGLHTATVVGKSGEEIWTDEHGRIRVQFHWDRKGKKDEKSSCWVRVVTPWSGKGWGFVAVPRMGQEVVIQFEEGDPDRPICTGMLYNKETMPPYQYPGDQTQSGIKTNSSKGGKGFHELMFEDKKGEELVRFQSEKDYHQIVKNNAVITVGTEKKDKGDLSLNVHNDYSEVVGHHKSEVISEKYDQSIGAKNVTSDILQAGAKAVSWVKDAQAFTSSSTLFNAGASKLTKSLFKDAFKQTITGNHSHIVTAEYKQLIGLWHSQTVLGKYDESIGLTHAYEVVGKLTEKIGKTHKYEVVGDLTEEMKANYTQKITGKHEKEVEKDVVTVVTKGDMKTNVKKGKVKIEAKLEILLKVGKSSIKIDNSGVTIKGPIIKVQAEGMAEVKGKITTVKADTMLTLKGKMTMIN